MAPRSRLREARRRAGMHQWELGKRLGVGRNFILRVEAGTRHPRFELMELWIRELGQFGSWDLWDSSLDPEEETEERQTAA